ncbi:MAG TPA: AAA family ATPase [Bacteroidales bacterium]|nr:AAA family ATPase [Bacteroidales bacterium]
MAAADQIKSLVKSFGEGDEERFFTTAMQIAASEARNGHTIFAQELKSLIEKAKKNRSLAFLDRNKTIPILQPSRELHELIEVFQPKIKLNDMILTPEVKEALIKLVNEQRHWEILRQYNLMPRRKLLLQGPPGCGKTMTAQALAGELGVPVFIVRLDGLISKFMGESISKLRLIFDAMPNHRGIYLFDEFDSIGSHRNQGQDVGEIKRVLNSFLINIEKDLSNSVIIAATNMPESLDKALFRRFDDIITFPLPNENEIIDTIKKNLAGFKFSQRINYPELAIEAEGLNYSDIVRACEDTIKEMILKRLINLEKSDMISALKKRKS